MKKVLKLLILISAVIFSLQIGHSQNPRSDSVNYFDHNIAVYADIYTHVYGKKKICTFLQENSFKHYVKISVDSLGFLYNIEPLRKESLSDRDFKKINKYLNHHKKKYICYLINREGKYYDVRHDSYNLPYWSAFHYDIVEWIRLKAKDLPNLNINDSSLNKYKLLRYLINKYL